MLKFTLEAEESDLEALGETLRALFGKETYLSKDRTSQLIEGEQPAQLPEPKKAKK